MLEKLKAEACRANLDLVRKGLVIETWGNASGIDRERGLVVIKPSGVPYDGMKPEHMVVVSLADGKVIDGNLKPSSDTPTHLVLYRAFPQIGGVVHTHSLFATAWAQAQRGLPSYGTTQADYWYGDVPCTRLLKPAEIKNDYEANTGKVIVETFKKLKFDPLHHPAVAVPTAFLQLVIGRLASETLKINPKLKPMQSVLLDKHFLRKHGANAYYGQK
jgi:L-ribulose-5-phosphate 4-epimerase